ncbi:hypothetical protein L2E82_22061 [Cichorium intybus]|uniref:Uncharacterized protein n=1 Tax=Cichorium intybus TaxID=13427 RepID=A0ACB9DXS6_CICIN|nr:hypothetical protein L2E82_22061 [Cichorium intybus]
MRRIHLCVTNSLISTKAYKRIHANKKTRNTAYEIIVRIGHACVYEDSSLNKENLHSFFNMVASGLAGKTPHMISTAVKGIAWLTCLIKVLKSTNKSHFKAKVKLLLGML